MHLEERFDHNAASKKNKKLSEKRILEISSGKNFFHDFANFSISENILKFTLCRKVLFPLNEKYSGLKVFEITRTIYSYSERSE